MIPNERTTPRYVNQVVGGPTRRQLLRPVGPRRQLNAVEGKGNPERFLRLYKHAKSCNEKCSMDCARMKEHIRHVSGCEGCGMKVCSAVRELMNCCPRVDVVGQAERTREKGELMKLVPRHVRDSGGQRECMGWVLREEEVVFRQSGSAEAYSAGMGELRGTIERRLGGIRPEDVREAFRGVLERVGALGEAAAFLRAVDPVIDGAENYYEVIKEPMDLGTMAGRLEGLEYRCPWELIEDFNRMVRNARIYNNAKHPICKAAGKLLSAFSNECEEVMRGLKYCCGQKQTFNLQMLYCGSAQGCQIGGEARYYANEGELLCERCYEARENKCGWRECRNNVQVDEGLVTCKLCGRRMHEVCVLYQESLYPEGFICGDCRGKGARARVLTLSAASLPQNVLSRFIEERVNQLIRREAPQAGYVHARVLSATEKNVDVRPLMRARYPELPESFPYRFKALYFFEEAGGAECLFFSLQTQEYHDCPPPNSRCVYIAYLDSVNLFSAQHLRTKLYHQIVTAYLDHVRSLGYVTAYIWACPPSDRDDYIFHCHPPDQRIPNAKRLSDWYRQLLATAQSQHAILSFEDLSLSQHLTPPEMPYMDGDFWPSRFEEMLKQDDEPKRKKRTPNPDTLEMFQATLDRNRNVFFVIRLNHNHPAPIADPDPLVHCDLTDTRDSFLNFCRERNHEFSSRRRALFSTQAVLLQLMNLYECNNCRRSITHLRHHCPLCKDFDLCPDCLPKVHHPHALVAHGNKPDSLLDGINHTLTCPDVNCQRHTCRRYRTVLCPHFASCSSPGCGLCSVMTRIYSQHVASCTSTNCKAKYCQHFKRILASQQLQRRNQNQAIHNRRFRSMNVSPSPTSPFRPLYHPDNSESKRPAFESPHLYVRPSFDPYLMARPQCSPRSLMGKQHRPMNQLHHSTARRPPYEGKGGNPPWMRRPH